MAVKRARSCDRDTAIALAVDSIWCCDEIDRYSDCCISAYSMKSITDRSALASWTDLSFRRVESLRYLDAAQEQARSQIGLTLHSLPAAPQEYYYLPTYTVVAT